MEEEKKVKLVIEIPEEQYSIILETITGIREEMRRKGYAKNDVVSIGWTAIADGKVLPRGHGRLIDADKLNTRPNYGNNSTRTMWYNIEAMVNKAPTVLEADV